MIGLTVIPNAEGCWPDLQDKAFIHVAEGPPIELAIVEMGMTSGRPSIVMRIAIPGGSPVVVETSARLFCSAAKIIMAKYPGLFEGD